MGFCFPFNLTLQEWVIGLAIAFLIFIAVWNDRREGKWKKFKKEFREEKKINGKKIKEAGLDKWLYYIEKGLDYLSGGLIIRQILNPYILFPFSILLFWLLKINNVVTGDLLLILTLVAIIWYSRETLVLRQEQWKSNKIAQKNNEIQEKPILNFYLRGYEMRLRNVGNGPAYNIVISNIDAKNFTYSMDFNQPNFILEPHKDEKTLTFNVRTPSGGSEIFGSEPQYFELFIDRLFPRDTDPKQYDSLKRSTAVFLINYQGLNSKSYYSIFRLYPKFWPLLNAYKLIIEYIESGNGECKLKKAKEICEKKNISPSLSVV